MIAAELAKVLGIDKATMSRWQKRGCPMEPEAAKGWADTNLASTGRPRGRREAAQTRSEALPLPESSLMPKIAEVAHIEAPRANGGACVIALQASSTPDQILERLNEVERQAFAQVKKALRAKSPAASWAVKVYKDAARNLIDGRQLCLRAAERERLLVSGPRMQQIAAERSSLMANLARAMPRQLAPRVHSGTVEDAERELTSWVQNQFLKTLYAAYGRGVDA